MGYEAVLSELNVIFYNPQDHTHESCVKEVANADLVILIIGSRFGGTGVKGLQELIDFKSLSGASLRNAILDNRDKLSITQYEILNAIERGIPVYCFVEEGVWHDHRVYEENKDNEGVIKNMRFPSIQKNETAPFIFEFVNFMRSRTHNNAIFPFGKLEDIEDCLLKQWSYLFQNLLSQSKNKSETSIQMNQISEQLNDMKALIMSSVNAPDASKEAAKGVLRFRSLINYVDCFLPNPSIIYKNQDWKTMLNACDIVRVDQVEMKGEKNRLVLMKSDGSFFYHYLSFADSSYYRHEKEWPEFSSIPTDIKRIIVDAVRDSSPNYKDLRYVNIPLEVFLKSSANTQPKQDDIPF